MICVSHKFFHLEDQQRRLMETDTVGDNETGPMRFTEPRKEGKMDVWQLAMYSGASFLALKSLISLMAHHRRQFQRQLVLEYQRELQQTAKSAEPAQYNTEELAPAEVAT